jgi:hypothetical protein
MFIYQMIKPQEYLKKNVKIMLKHFNIIYKKRHKNWLLDLKKKRIKMEKKYHN